MSHTSATSPTTRGWKGLHGWQKVAAGGAVVAGVLGVIVAPGLWESPPAKKADEQPRTQAAQQFQQANFNDPPPGSQAQDGGPPANDAPRPAIRRVLAPIAISGYRGGDAQAQPGRNQPQGRGEDGALAGRQGDLGALGGGQAAAGDPTSLAAQVSGGVEMATATAGYSANGDYIIGANTNIPCLPVETHNSAMGGFATCRVPEWVRGDTQRVGLLPPGTLIKGQIRGGMAQGQARLGVLYRQIVTSGDRFTVNMTAVGSDAQGRSGLDADVKTFFWDTAGAVALYSLIQGATSAVPTALGALASQGGGFAQLNIGGGAGGSSLANTLLQHRLNRPPEAERDWALPMHVTVGVDLDFTKVCRDRRRINPMACPRM